MTTKTKRLTESAMLLAVAIILELLSKTFIPEMTFGGQLTIVSMLPVVLISYRHGLKWGFAASFTYALIEMVIGLGTISAAFLPSSDSFMGVNALLMVFLDYILAYTLLGLRGIFRNSSKNPSICLMCGSLVALGARYVAHILSGYILYASWAEWFFTQDGFPAWGAQLVSSLDPTLLGFVYSIVYNGMYMIPEMIFTAIAAFLIARPQITEKLN